MTDDFRLPAGVWPVVLAPFHEDRSIDWQALHVLIDWYLESGVAGLFVTAQSAEVTHLTDEEKRAIAECAIRRVRGRVPVVAGAYSCGPSDRQIALIRSLAALGADAVILSTCQLLPEACSRDGWQDAVNRILPAVPGVRLGCYEMPVPYHRLLTPDEIRWTASTGRFFFHKDTSCDMASIREKLQAIQATPLRFYNAHTPTLLESLLAGGHGYSGIATNYAPELCVSLCHSSTVDLDRARRIQQTLTAIDARMHVRYPAAAKAFLHMRGLPLQPFCRTMDHHLAAEELTGLEELMQTVTNAARHCEIRPQA